MPQARILLALVYLAVGFFPRESRAQRLADVPRLGMSAHTDLSKSLRLSASSSHASSGRSAAPDSATHRRWPIYALGGAVIGGAGAAIVAVRSCDQACRHDEGPVVLPPLIAIGALIGGLVGALVGLSIDAH